MDKSKVPRFYGPRCIKYTNMRQLDKKNSKSFSAEGPARMFLRAPLWLSTGLPKLLGLFQTFK